ncbi:MAG: hydrogenase maturation nickel metallochaperone HypA, partial [Treponema sp.]|nr:hydrogenase maturation nickel metallochaperone HypA [Treponema sp.]
MKKKPRFFCDNCGYEVSSDVKLCPYCGRHFASI